MPRHSGVPGRGCSKVYADLGLAALPLGRDGLPLPEGDGTGQVGHKTRRRFWKRPARSSVPKRPTRLLPTAACSPPSWWPRSSSSATPCTSALVDALYFVVTTATTTGYGDISLKDTPDWLKLFGCARDADRRRIARHPFFLPGRPGDGGAAG